MKQVVADSAREVRRERSQSVDVEFMILKVAMKREEATKEDV